MRLFKTTLLATITLFTLTGCCWTDHSETIKQVAEPMLQELKIFYEKNNRYPNKDERNILYRKAGCNEVIEEKCFYEDKIINISKTGVLYDSYFLYLSIENTLCYGTININTKFSTFSCQQEGCIKWQH